MDVPIGKDLLGCVVDANPESDWRRPRPPQSTHAIAGAVTGAAVMSVSSRSPRGIALSAAATAAAAVALRLAVPGGGAC